MAGFDNDVMYAKNADFTQSDNQSPSESNGLVTNSQLWIGSTALNAGGTHVNVGTFTSPDNSISFSYSSPNIIATVAGGSTVGKTITGNTGGALSPTSGNWNIITSNTTVKFVGSGSTLTEDFGLSNLLIGSPGSAITSGVGNVALGTGSLSAITSGSNNTALGISLNSLSTGSGNIVIGSAALPGGGNYTTSESNNIAIGNSGAGAESNTIRIGTQGSGVGQQNRTFVAGITGVTAAGSPAAISSTGQLSDLGFGTSTQVLTSNGAGVSPTWQAAASASGVITTTYNVADSPATWTKNANTKFVTVYVWGGGGGGGSGRKGVSGAAGGGGGGGGSSVAIFSGPVSAFGNTENVIIGAGGAGGASQAADGNNGNVGISGNTSSFGTITAIGGANGGGGTTTSGAAGSPRTLSSQFANTTIGNTGGSGSQLDGGAGSNESVFIGSTGGGGGGGADVVTQRAGGAGGAILNTAGGTILLGASGGLESTGINGATGNPAPTSGGVFGGGSGGGGGGGGYSVGAGGATTGGTGGTGSVRGGGGGGGGGGISAVANSGAGGQGGDGQVIVVEFL